MNRIFGANIFYDYRNTDYNEFHQLGFGVEIFPDDDLDEFYSCSFTIFDLSTDEAIMNHSLTTIVDDGNSMRFTDRVGTEYDLSCAIDAEGATASYEITGKLAGQQVFSHVSSVRLQR